MNRTILEKHMSKLAHFFRFSLAEDYSILIIRDFQLPPGFNRKITPVWIEIPKDYPESPPGVGDSRVYVPKGLEFRGRIPNDYHPHKGPRGWAWWCYESIDWDPCKDDLLVFCELLRTHMTNPT